MMHKSWTRKTKLGLSLGLILLWSGHFPESVASMVPEPPLEESANPAQESRPQGLQPQGLQLIQEACVQCHDLSLVFSQPKTGQVWEETIARMIWRGAPLFPGEARIIQNYLVSDYSRNMPSSPTTPGNLVSQLPEGLGKRLVVEACVGCHDLSPILRIGRSEPEWRRIVEEMVVLGTSLGEGESDAVINYLSTSFRP